MNQSRCPKWVSVDNTRCVPVLKVNPAAIEVLLFQQILSAYHGSLCRPPTMKGESTKPASHARHMALCLLGKNDTHQSKHPLPALWVCPATCRPCWTWTSARTHLGRQLYHLLTRVWHHPEITAARMDWFASLTWSMRMLCRVLQSLLNQRPTSLRQVS